MKISDTKDLLLRICPIAIFIVLYYLAIATASNSVKIPFKTKKPIKFEVILKDRYDSPVKALITLYEYTPPLRIDQTFGIKWEDLDFKTIEQLYIGHQLFKTREQFLSMYDGNLRKLASEGWDEKTFEKDMARRNITPLSERALTYFSKLLIEVSGEKYLLEKSGLTKEDAALGAYCFVDGKIKYSDQIDKDLNDFDLKCAFQDKTPSEFVRWIKEDMKAKEIYTGPSVIFILLISAGAIILLLIIMVLKKTLRK